MKTIATAAALMMLTATAWADEPKHQEQAANDEPIVLSEAEMDTVSAGSASTFMFNPETITRTWNTNSTSDRVFDAEGTYQLVRYF